MKADGREKRTKNGLIYVHIQPSSSMYTADQEGKVHCDFLCLHHLEVSWNQIPQNWEYNLWKCIMENSVS